MDDLEEFAASLADLTTHRIEGIAVMGDTPFSVPIISQVDDNLWQGGFRDGPLPGFEYVLSLYPWGRYDLPFGTVRREAKLYDRGDVPDVNVLEDLASWVNEARKHGRTLVHCQAGLNRSALVTALALIRSGMTAVDAIALLRAKRSPAVLCNSAFEEWLLTQ